MYKRTHLPYWPQIPFEDRPLDAWNALIIGSIVVVTVYATWPWLLVLLAIWFLIERIMRWFERRFR